MDRSGRHPGIGERVGMYKVVMRLGAGGLGVVYKVERDGRFFALKLLGPVDGRTRREISVLVHLEHPGVVRYVGSDFWPNPVMGQPYIVMEYVPGETLEAFALKHNPCARQCLRLLLDVARTLGEVHGAGVFHRDLKPTNILIHETSGRPVLIDLGIASLEGAAQVTQTRLPPATEEFRAPEPLRFLRENADTTASYEYVTSDELWALGVTLYWLLTDVLPFGDRTDEGGVQGLRERILTQRPVAPHLVNPRVPLAASRLCMKMLAEWPAERHATVAELCAALQETLTQAENDSTWDVLLVDPHDPQVITTLEDPGRRQPDDWLRALHQASKRRPRRGLARPEEAPMAPPPPRQVEPPGLPRVAAEPERIARVDAPREAVPVEEHKPPGNPPPPATRAPVASPRGPLAPDVAAGRSSAPGRLGLAAAVVALAVVGLSVSKGPWGPGAGSPTAPGQPEAMRPSLSPPHDPTGGVVTGHEVAPAPEPLEPLPGEGAVPVGAPPPAPTAHAMPRTPAQTKKNETQTQRPGLRLPVKPAVMAMATMAGCTLMEGCTGSTPQVRPGPPVVTCPQDWRETHKRFNVARAMLIANVKGEDGNESRVKDGPAVLVANLPDRMGRLGDFPEGTLLLGAWKLGDGRLFGTFTEAKVPGQGTLPVCLVAGVDHVSQFIDEHNNPFDCPAGLGVCLTPGSTPGNAKTSTVVVLDGSIGQP